MGDPIFQQLKEYFNNTPEEELRREWVRYNKYNKIGPTIEEWLSLVKEVSQEHKEVIEKYERATKRIHTGRTFSY